jgi:hypothetical protein
MTTNEKTGVALPDDLSELHLSTLAYAVRADWLNPYFGAVPYIDAMGCLASVNDDYGCDRGDSIVMYFLSNAGSWRGPIARVVKAELRKRVGL